MKVWCESMPLTALASMPGSGNVKIELPVNGMVSPNSMQVKAIENRRQ